MAGFYDDMAQVAIDMITEFGITGVISDATTGEYDPESGAVSGGTVAQNGQMILLNYTYAESGQKHAEGTQVLVGDKKILIAAKGLEWPPTITSKIVANGATWSVVNIKETSPAGIPLIYEIHGRK